MKITKINKVKLSEFKTDLIIELTDNGSKRTLQWGVNYSTGNKLDLPSVVRPKSA